MENKSISTSKAILTHKCPRCHQGDMYLVKNPYTHPSKMSSMYSHCPVCNQNYSPETGFYFGAAYVSYGLTIAFGVALMVASYVFGVRTISTIMWIIGIGLVIVSPHMLRYSRTIWAHIFIKYKGK